MREGSTFHISVLYINLRCLAKSVSPGGGCLRVRGLPAGDTPRRVQRATLRYSRMGNRKCIVVLGE